MPLNYLSKLIFAIFITLLLFVPMASAADDMSAVSWNITQSQLPANYIGSDFHISVLSYWILFAVGILFFLLSLRWAFENGTDVIAALAMIIFGFLSFVGFFVQDWSYEVVTTQLNETAQISIVPVVYTQPSWVMFITAMMLVISVINLYRISIGIMVASATDPISEIKERRR